MGGLRAGKTLCVDATLKDCCALLSPRMLQPQRLDLNCMALPAGKDVLSALLALVQGTGRTGAQQPAHTASMVARLRCWHASLCEPLVRCI